MNYKQRLGYFGEQLARDYLIRRGHKIIGLNVKLSYQELDIIAYKRGLTIFVEVKTRISQVFGPAENAIAFTKLARLNKGIDMYTKNNKINLDSIRADLITVDICRSTKIAKIKHYLDII